MALIPSSNVGGITIIAIEAFTGGLAIVTIILRIWARRLRHKPLDASDWTCISGLLLALILLASVVYDVTRGLGLPLLGIHANGDAKKSSSPYSNLLVGMYLWTISTTLLRMSTILVYRRMFPLFKFEIICGIFFVINLAVAVGACLTAILICLPIDDDWLHLTPGNRCEPYRQNLYFAHGLVNLIFDVIIIALPMPLLWKLHLPKNQKKSLIFVFALGLGICVMTLTRTIEVERGSVYKITTSYISVSLLTAMEPLVGVITCSLPLLRPVKQRLFGGTDSSDYTHGENFVKSIGQRGKLSKGLDPYNLGTNFTNSSMERLNMAPETYSRYDERSGRPLQYPPAAAARWHANIP